MPGKHFGIRAMAAVAVVALTGTGVASAPASTSAVSVQVKAEHLTGFRPDGSIVTVQLHAMVEGADASSLAGGGKHFGSGGAHVDWAWNGSMDGDQLRLTGLITETNRPYLAGTPGELFADASAERVTLRFGPLRGGRFDGKTITVEGPGRMIVVRDGDAQREN